MNEISQTDSLLHHALYSRQAEQYVIGAILLSNAKWDEIAGTLGADDFGDTEHQKIYEAISCLLSAGDGADPFTVAKKLFPGQPEQHEYTLMQMAANCPAVNIRAYAQSVRSASINRKLLSVMSSIQSDISSLESNVLEQAQAKIMAINSCKDAVARHAGDVASVVLEQIEEVFERKELPGLPTGYSDLDNKTHGLQNGDLIILAARPGMGKTTFAMNIAEHVAIKKQQTVAVFSLEMPAEQLVKRLMASCGRIDFELIRSARLGHEEFATKAPRAIGAIAESKLYIDDSPGLSILELRSRALRIKREHGLSLIVVDYLQLMQEKAESETVKISNISAGLKRIAKELNVPVIALSQLNRNVEQRADKRPLMADLRQSGAIEQDADLILFLYREEVYEPETNAKGTAELSISKHRNGETGMFRLAFNGRHCRFDNYSGEVIEFTRKQVSGWKHGFNYDE